MYVRNWVIAKQLTLFKLSNTVYQAVFTDKSEILMSSKSMALIYIDKDRKRHSHLINSAEIQTSRSLNVRIDYFKKVLKRWIERDSNTSQLNSTSRSTSVLTQSTMNSTSSGR